MRRLILAALLMLSAGAARADVLVEAPRKFGWWIGDVLTHRAILVPPDGQLLDPASLPRPRAVNYWLNLRETTSEQADIDGKPAVVITTRWQVFYSPLEPSLREVGPYSVAFRGEGGASTIEVPGWSFVVSPLRPILAPNSPAEMQPDHAIVMAPASGQVRASFGFGLLTGFFLLLLAWLQAWPPFHARPGRPFAAAAQAVARARGDARAMALALHRGLDAAHGSPLLAADLSAFLAARPNLAPLADRLSDFFARSSDLFFGDASPTGDDAAAIAALARGLAAIEGGRA